MLPIRQLITELRGDGYSTSSLVIPIIRGLTKTVNRMDVTTKVEDRFKAKVLGVLSRFK